jgi:cell division septation protein DedD
MQGDTQLGWWASGASISTSAPSQTITVSNPGSFSVSPATFSGYTGNWYHISPSNAVNGSAFTVLDPQLDLRLEDTTVNVDVTNKWVPTGDDIRFRIGTNLVSITQRGVSSVPITIKVQSPTGGVYSALANSAGTTSSIVDIPVTSSDFTPSLIWNTGSRDLYPPGTYTIWAVCNVNSMNDNYGQTGKTTSQQISLLDQDQNPLIGNKGYVTNPTTQVTTLVSTTIPTTIIPVTTTPAPTTTITTTSTTTPPETTPVATTTAAKPKATPSPGFDGALVVLAAVLGVAAYTRRN